MSQTLTISWDDLRQDTHELAIKLKDMGEWEGIIAVARGGLVPATLLAYELGIRLVDTLCLASYDENHQQKELEVLNLPNIVGKGNNWLVIDDLSDTGITANTVRELMPEAYMAVLYTKPAGEKAVDWFVKGVSQDTWIVFPWEENE